MLASPMGKGKPPPHQRQYVEKTPRNGRQTGLRSRTTQLMAIRFGWAVLVVWFEVGEFFSSLSSCKFPDARVKSRLSPAPTHVVLIADPHVPHYRLSYPSDSNRWANVLRQAFDELFMRKSWNIVMRIGRIDSVIMLGDMLDWGRGVMSEEEYESYHALFRSIFSLPSSIPVHFVPGNHDVPLGPHRLFSAHSRERYERYFSDTNLVLPIANHSLILLDSIGLVEEDYRRYAAEMQFGEWDGMEGGVIEFVKTVAESAPAPRILVTHIPLARPEASQCGQHRERGRIQKGAGPGYQNLLGSETSEFLLEELQPVVVFSGDDHDYCEHTHPGKIREVTVKSFSSSSGIRRPGLQLLSLIPPSTESGSKTYADRPCFLPDQVGVYNRVYFPLIILTTMFILGTNIRQAWSRSSPDRDRDRDRDSHSRTGHSSSNHRGPVRKSSQLLSAHHRTSYAQSTARPARFAHPHGYGHHGHSGVSPEPMTRSAPVSPRLSATSLIDEKERDREEVNLASPGSSRRSSFVYNEETEPPSYFSPRKDSGSSSPYDSVESGIGLGISTGNSPYQHPYGFPSSTNLRSPSLHPPSPAPSTGSVSPLYPSFPSRRVTMPRTISSPHDPVRDARHRDRSANGLGARGEDSGDFSRRRGVSVQSFLRWIWNARNSVLVRSAWEMWNVFWVVGVVWIMVNGLFFLG